MNKAAAFEQKPERSREIHPVNINDTIIHLCNVKKRYTCMNDFKIFPAILKYKKSLLELRKCYQMLMKLNCSHKLTPSFAYKSGINIQ